MRIPSHNLTGQLSELAVTLSGLLVAATPLVLWVAWNGTVFIAALLVSAAAIGLICVLARRDNGHNRDPTGVQTLSSRAISHDMLSELSDLGPWIHHHQARSAGGPRFAHHMRSLKRRLNIE